ncbi:MAG: beta-galactosidase [Lachnospirales bacterium]
MALYIGVNYHPHDWSLERIKEDIILMKEAGFTTVRLGHLCWDSYEPDEGVYTFNWFDTVMDLFEKENIGVFLDISVRPAPTWVHKLCPGSNIHGKSGMISNSLSRYMEDIDDPSYQHYALRFAKTLVNRYKNHKALFAFGLCNEIGDGYISYSNYAKERFSQWLKKKYKTIENLNAAWATQRWSRKINSFSDVMLQENESSIGSPEAYLDMRRFFSDGVGNFIVKLKEIVEDNAPDIPHSSNHYAEKSSFGFDYMKFYNDFVDYPGVGIYPGYSITEKYMFTSSVYQHRIAETNKPMWCLEFQTGSTGVSNPPIGSLHMLAMLHILNRSEMILAWTWRSMLGGEEQFLFGLLGHDGIPGPMYYEYQKIATDMNKLSKYSLPYLPNPEIGVAYSNDNQIVATYANHQFQQDYFTSISKVHEVFYDLNLDYNMVDLKNLKNDYKVLVVSNYIVMDNKSSDTIRDFVKNGGIVVMTGNSAFTDETGKVFSTSRPGNLDDVFGIRINGFYRTNMEWTFNNNSNIVNGCEKLSIVKEAENITVNSKYYEILECTTANRYAEFKDKDLCAITENNYGRGKAYYISTESDTKLITWLLNKIYVYSSPDLPKGIQYRMIDKDQFFYVNTTNTQIEIDLSTINDFFYYGVLTEKEYRTKLVLKPYESELLIVQHMDRL